jgi:hypothetical protein
MEALRVEYDAARTYLQSMIAMRREAIRALQQEMSKLQSAANKLIGSIDQTSSARYDGSIRTLYNALRTGIMTGVGEAAEIAASLTSEGYASSVNFERDQARNLALIASVRNLADEQLSTEELMLKAMEDSLTLLDEQFRIDQAAEKARFDAFSQYLTSIVDSYREQFDILRGIDNSIFSVERAIAMVELALSNMAKTTLPDRIAPPPEMTPSVIMEQIRSIYKNMLNIATPDAAGLQYWTNEVMLKGWDATLKAMQDAAVRHSVTPMMDLTRIQNMVMDAYRNILGVSDPENHQAGIEYWAAEVQKYGWDHVIKAMRDAALRHSQLSGMSYEDQSIDLATEANNLLTRIEAAILNINLARDAFNNISPTPVSSYPAPITGPTTAIASPTGTGVVSSNPVSITTDPISALYSSMLGTTATQADIDYWTQHANTYGYNTLEDTIRQAAIENGVVPAYASGGMHAGGLRIVGEQGPELESTGASRIFSARQTAQMMRDDRVVEELIALRREVVELKRINYETAVNTNYISKDLRRWDIDGLPPFRDGVSFSGSTDPGYSTFSVPD